MVEEGIYPPHVLSIEKVKQILSQAISSNAAFNAAYMFKVSGVILPPEANKRPYKLVNPANPTQYLSLGYKVPEKYRDGSVVPVTLVVSPEVTVARDGAAIYVNYQIQAARDGSVESVESRLLRNLKASLHASETSPFYTGRIPKFETPPDHIYAIVSQSEQSSIYSDIINQVDPLYHGYVEPVFVSVKDPSSIAYAVNSLDRDNVIIVLARGGGAEEDFDAFSDPEVLEAITRSRAYIITALGHSKNVTMADLVSDARLTTPTDAGIFLNNIFKDSDPFNKNVSEDVRGLQLVNERLEKRLETKKRELQEAQKKTPQKRSRLLPFLLGSAVGALAFACMHFGYQTVYQMILDCVKRYLP